MNNESFFNNSKILRVKEGNKETDILKAAIKVFAETGYYNSKMSRIAEVADVSTGSLYVYYTNKEEILLKILDTVWKDLYEKTSILAKRKDINNIEKFDTMMDMIFDAFTESPEIAVVIANEQKHFQIRKQEHFTPYFEKFLKLGEYIVAEGVKKNIFNPNFNINLLRIFIIGGFGDLITVWAMNKDKVSLGNIRTNIKFLIKHGILNSNKV